MARGGHGLPKVSPGPAMPYPSMPCGRLLPLWSPHAVRLCLYSPIVGVLRAEVVRHVCLIEFRLHLGAAVARNQNHWMRLGCTRHTMDGNGGVGDKMLTAFLTSRQRNPHVLTSMPYGRPPCICGAGRMGMATDDDYRQK
jgi:hypothetical protein